MCAVHDLFEFSSDLRGMCPANAPFPSTTRLPAPPSWPPSHSTTTVPTTRSSLLFYMLQRASRHVALTPPRRRYSINNQEIPAVYVNAFLDNLVAYTGAPPPYSAPPRPTRASLRKFADRNRLFQQKT
jgi:hypothetical protein